MSIRDENVQKKSGTDDDGIKKMSYLCGVNDLSRHIEYLLLTHNCVIVPQFGAFVAHVSNAQRTEGEELFFPPHRVVRFNPELIEDDGLLVDVVRAVHRCTTVEAKRMIQGMVLQLRQQLLAEGQADFGSIGIFTQDEDGKMNFSACQAGATTPSLYGLDAFHMSKLTSLQRRKKLANKHRKAEEDITDSGNHIVIRISRRTLRYVTTAAAVIILCVLFAPPFQAHRERMAQQASVLSASKEVANEPVATMATAVIPTTKTDENAKATSETMTEGPVAAAEIEAKDIYAIVVASNVSRKNAEHYVEELRHRGYENASIHDNGKMLRVVLSGYADETEAYNRNAALHHESKEFASSWVMKL